MSFRFKYDPQRIEMQKSRQRPEIGGGGVETSFVRRSEAVDVLDVVVE